ncbi:MAG TPA: ribosome biogenesis GTPase Der [Vitreimonas sp.]|uniref:ribosome biogenesis GTPase Der n=1 Tax=Vitreimonas sp. TaxID=3069702 RepID=UPI002D6E1279|nr:ribosome biogenesis GTPase Der [Vitreimonas sp.]HYD88058.1 ribosome biogenesis GTPase Der [Vitreimonas sp.]
MTIKLAIVGRPNVGKSTLFNRLAGKKLAIVDDTPGVTRDRREAQGRLGDLDFTLVDTAGFEDLTDASLEARMRAQTEIAIREADIILFLIDARAGVLPLDEAFASLLRRADKPVVLAANKAEGRAGDVGINEAFALGLGEPIPLSAEHGEGMAELYAALAAHAPEPEDEDAEKRERPIQLTIVGRPNAGKSTLVNALIGEDRLLVGPEAGITRDSIAIDWAWQGKPYRLIDTAGMRKKAKVQAKLERMSVGDTLNAIRFADVCVLVMDANEAFEKQDLSIADLVVREGRGLVFVLAKWDTIADPRAHFEEMKLVARESLPQARGAPIVTVAAQSGVGLDRLMKAVEQAHTDWTARVKTKDLNDWLYATIARHPPPAVRGKRIKPRYLTQIKSRPPTFVLIASRAEEMPESYKRYLVNGLRDAFDLHASPIRLIVKAGKNPFADEAG